MTLEEKLRLSYTEGIAEGKELGIAEGKELGIYEQKKHTIRKMLQKATQTKEEIAELMEVSVSFVDDVAAAGSQTDAPSDISTTQAVDPN